MPVGRGHRVAQGGEPCLLGGVVESKELGVYVPDEGDFKDAIISRSLGALFKRKGMQACLA